MPVIKTKGAASSQGFGEFAKSAAANYIEDVFSTWLYTGNGSTQTITNGIDLAGKGGLVWVKSRSLAYYHNLVDTIRGAQKSIFSNTTNAQVNVGAAGLNAFTSNGFSIGTEPDYNSSGDTYVSWTFRKQSKFFDVVTYTGNGANRTISHNLGAVPGCIIVKRTDAAANWPVYHRGLSNVEYVLLNDTSIAGVNSSLWNSTTPTSTVFSLGTDTTVNASGGTYVAYIFAHDAGGFGLLGTDNVISCGSYTGNGSATGPTISLGYEPQLVFIKKASGSGGGDWHIFDVMRGWSVAGNTADLNPNTSYAESSSSIYAAPNATGFQVLNTWTDLNQSGSTYIYIAIRRGPMKVPTLGTSVFGINSRSGSGVDATVTGGQTDDFVIIKNIFGSVQGSLWASRLTGTGYFQSNAAIAETAAGTTILQANPWDIMDGVKVGTTSTITNSNTSNFINYLVKRAPGFFDVVCYTGTGSATTQTHNLGVAPDLMFVKGRSAATAWQVYSSGLANTEYLVLNTNAAKATGATRWNSTTATSTVFSIGTDATVNTSGNNYIAYLFASLAGISKLGTYTGTGALQVIDCGFTSGARFVFIKRTNSTGDWYVYDTVRGMVSGTNPFFLFNTGSAQNTSTEYVYTSSTGFTVTAAAATSVNVSTATYIFFAIA